MDLFEWISNSSHQGKKFDACIMVHFAVLSVKEKQKHISRYSPTWAPSIQSVVTTDWWFCGQQEKECSQSSQCTCHCNDRWVLQHDGKTWTGQRNPRGDQTGVSRLWQGCRFILRRRFFGKRLSVMMLWGMVKIIQMFMILMRLWWCWLW